MIRRFRALGYGAAGALGRLRQRPLAVALTTGSVAVSLLLFGLVQLAAHNVERMTGSWGAGVHMVVYLEQEVGEEHAGRIGEALRDLPGVEAVDYVSPEAAHAHLEASLGDDDDLLRGVEVGMLPASLEVTLAEGVVDVASAHPVADRLASTAGVEDVEFPGEWVQSVTSLLSGLRAAAFLLLLLVGGACVYVVASSVRLGLRERRGESQLLRLIGASETFVRIPIAIEGALVGALGAAIALLLLGGLYGAFAGAVEATLAAAFGSAPIAFLPPSDMAAIVGFGGALGMLGSLVGAGRERGHALA